MAGHHTWPGVYLAFVAHGRVGSGVSQPSTKMKHFGRYSSEFRIGLTPVNASTRTQGWPVGLRGSGRRVGGGQAEVDLVSAGSDVVIDNNPILQSAPESNSTAVRVSLDQLRTRAGSRSRSSRESVEPGRQKASRYQIFTAPPGRSPTPNGQHVVGPGQGNPLFGRVRGAGRVRVKRHQAEDEGQRPHRHVLDGRGPVAGGYLIRAGDRLADKRGGSSTLHNSMPADREPNLKFFRFLVSPSGISPRGFWSCSRSPGALAQPPGGDRPAARSARP